MFDQILILPRIQKKQQKVKQILKFVGLKKTKNLKINRTKD